MCATVTVLVPAYNRACYIEECIRSVQTQSLQDLEILIIDDGSEDCTLPLCKTMMEADPRIRIIPTEHVGVSVARNIGLDAATGKYVFFLDSDDVIHPLLLETLVQDMEQHGIPIAAASRHNIPERSWHTVTGNMARYTEHGNTILKTPEEVLQDMLCGHSPMRIIGGVMIRRDFIGCTRFRTDLYIGEDYFFVYENLLKGSSALYLKEIWYYARLHSTNAAINFSADAFLNRLHRRELVWKSEDSFGRREYAAILKREVLTVFMRFINKAPTRLDQKQMRLGLRAYRKAVMPVLPLRNKLLFMLLCYCPFLEKPIVALMRKRHAI